VARAAGPGVVRLAGVAGVGVLEMGEGGAHAQDQDGQAGHGRGDGPRGVRHPGLGQEVVGGLPGHAQEQGRGRGPAGEPPGPVRYRGAGGEPGAQRVGGVGLDADRQGDGGVQVQGVPDPGQRVDLPEPGQLPDADPPGPDRDGGGQGEEQLTGAGAAGTSRTVLPVLVRGGPPARGPVPGFRVAVVTGRPASWRAAGRRLPGPGQRRGPVPGSGSWRRACCRVRRPAALLRRQVRHARPVRPW